LREQHLTVSDLTVSRGGRTVVDAVSFDVLPGEIVTVVGPNGAGKTSLLESILGFLPIDRGLVSFAGRELRALTSRAAVFSCMPESAEPPSEVRVAVLVEHAKRFGRPANGLAADLILRLGIARFLGARPAELSRGERRRLSLFTALCTDRPVVVLDEPLGAFDPLQLLDVLDVLRARAREGTSLILSVHQPRTAATSGRGRTASRITCFSSAWFVASGRSSRRCEESRPLRAPGTR
jgi:ABC-type multidrug transport system ATPase subunit